MKSYIKTEEKQIALTVTKEDRIEAARQQAISAARALAKSQAEVYYSENLNERIWWLFGGNFDWIDKVHQAELAIHAFFKMVAKPKIAEQIESQMGESNYEWFIEMLSEIPSFCQALQMEQFRGEIDAILYENQTFDEDFTGDEEKWFLTHAEDYKRKLSAFNVMESL
jgi:hypothetical protein